MAVYKVGQKVRITRQGAAPERKAGSTGTIVALNVPMPGWVSLAYGPCHGVAVDNVPPEKNGYWAVPVAALAPLTDPKAEEFLADMERFAKLAREGNAPRIPQDARAFGD